MKRRARAGDDEAWTVLVYQAGDNDLAPEMVRGLQEMRAAARDPAVARSLRLAVELDPAGGRPRRYVLARSEANAEGSLSKVGREAPRLEEGEIALERFLADVIETLPPSARYAVVLSGHGSGAVGDFLPDLEPRSALTLPMLAEVLSRTRERIATKNERRAPIEILGLDSCQMSSIELAHAARGSVRYLVASEGTVLEGGWPYRKVMESFAAGGSARAVARSIAGAYLRFYRDYEIAGQSTDVAVCAVGKIGAAVQSLAELAAALRESLGGLLPDGLEEGVELGEIDAPRRRRGVSMARELRDGVVLAHWSAQAYQRDRYVDLVDFCIQLSRYVGIRGRARPEAKRIRRICSKLARDVGRAVVVSGTTGPEFQHSHGLSIYFPWSSRDYTPEYRHLAFARETGWADFLAVYLAATRRMRRGEARHMTSEPLGRRDRLEPQSAAVKDPDAGTHRDPDSGTHRGRRCVSTMKNPPDGFHRRR